jgi:hypothetical protein
MNMEPVMRFGILVVAVVAGGLVTGVLIQPLLAPATNAPPPAPDKVPTEIHYSMADLNPLRLVYDMVMQKVASGDNAARFAVGKPVTADWTAMNRYVEQHDAEFNSEFSPDRMARINGEAAADRIREFNNRQQDISNYARNPAGWHGAPPF